jgi:superfamily II DNA helicase RecQ
MHAVLRGQTPLVVVLPSGGGKSLLFTVPAVVEKEGVTVVVVPYRALIEDLVARIQESGVDCMEWKHGENNPASVVVVSADLAGDITSNDNFIGYAGLLQTKGLLRRVVVDECHMIFTSSDWRPKLALPKNLRPLACPVVLLTATLPPVREDELESGMLVHNAMYIRASTVRPNTRYFVSWCPGDGNGDGYMQTATVSAGEEEAKGGGVLGWCTVGARRSVRSLRKSLAVHTIMLVFRTGRSGCKGG